MRRRRPAPPAPPRRSSSRPPPTPLPPPPAATAPAPSTAGRLSATALPVPAGWQTVARPGGAEEGFRGNGTWVHARDPRYAALDAITVGCADITRDDYTDPTAALEGNYRKGANDGVGAGPGLRRRRRGTGLLRALPESGQGLHAARRRSAHLRARRTGGARRRPGPGRSSQLPRRPLDRDSRTRSRPADPGHPQRPGSADRPPCGPGRARPDPRVTGATTLR